MSFNEIRFGFESLVIFYFIAINSMYTFVFLLSFFEVMYQKRRSFIEDYSGFARSKLAPGVSLIVTAFNERTVITESLKSYLKIHYPLFEVIVVNDGSTDETLDILIKEFKLKRAFRLLQTNTKSRPIRGYYVSDEYPNLYVIDKVNGGKGDALNAGLSAAHHQYFASLDADAMLQKDALLRIMKPIFENPRKVVGAGGIVRVINDCIISDGQVKEVRLSKDSLVIFQVLEYIRSFTANRTGFSFLKCLPISSGAFSLYNTGIAREMGGYDSNEIGEDFEFLTRLHKHLRDKKRPYEVKFCAYPICWTEVPDTLGSLGRQRNRWHRGLTSTLQKHERMILNPKYGMVGMFSLPFFLFFEFLGPIIEAAGYIILFALLFTGQLTPVFFMTFYLLAVLWGALLSMLAVLYEELNFKWYRKWSQVFTLIIYALLENISYRQINVIWRIHGLIDYIRGEKSWGAMQRRGFKHHHI